MSHGNPKRKLINGLRAFHCTHNNNNNNNMWMCVINYVRLSSDMYSFFGWKGHNILIINIKINTGLLTFYISFFSLLSCCPPASCAPFREKYSNIICAQNRRRHTKKRISFRLFFIRAPCDLVESKIESVAGVFFSISFHTNHKIL